MCQDGHFPLHRFPQMHLSAVLEVVEMGETARSKKVEMGGGTAEEERGKKKVKDGPPGPWDIRQLGCLVRAICHGPGLIESSSTSFGLDAIASLLLSTLWYMALACCSSKETQGMTV